MEERENLTLKMHSSLKKIQNKVWLRPLVNFASEKVNAQTGQSLSIAQRNNTDFSESNSATFDSKSVFRWQFLLKKYAGKIASTLNSWLSAGTSKFLNIFGLAIGFAMVPIYLYYFLKESAGIKASWENYVPLRASKFKTEVVETLLEINGYLVAFFRGQILVALIDGVLVGLALLFFGLPYGLLIGMFMAILGIIPYVGNMICLIPACIIAYVHFGQAPEPGWLGSNPWAYVIAVLVIFSIVQQFNSLVTSPRIVGDSVGLHPMTVIFSMLFWSLILGGFIGAILAVPLTASTKVLFRRYVWERKIMEPATS